MEIGRAGNEGETPSFTLVVRFTGPREKMRFLPRPIEQSLCGWFFERAAAVLHARLERRRVSALSLGISYALETCFERLDLRMMAIYADCAGWLIHRNYE